MAKKQNYPNDSPRKKLIRKDVADPVEKVEFHIPSKIEEKWQNIIDITAQIIAVPTGLIMRIRENDIEVFVSSHTDGNPYRVGDKENLMNSGLYCETVINTQKELLIPNALKDEKWKNNPDIKLNMISYLGFPILLPTGKPFGTICVLDNSENHYSTKFLDLLQNFRNIIETDLELVYMNHVLGEKNRRLLDYINEIQTLRQLIPICSACKKVRDDDGYWTQIEEYMKQTLNAEFTHGLCLECMDQMWGSEEWYIKRRNQK